MDLNIALMAHLKILPPFNLFSNLIFGWIPETRV